MTGRGPLAPGAAVSWGQCGVGGGADDPSMVLSGDQLPMEVRGAGGAGWGDGETRARVGPPAADCREGPAGWTSSSAGGGGGQAWPERRAGRRCGQRQEGPTQPPSAPPRHWTDVCPLSRAGGRDDNPPTSCSNALPPRQVLPCVAGPGGQLLEMDSLWRAMGHQPHSLEDVGAGSPLQDSRGAQALPWSGPHPWAPELTLSCGQG